MVKHPDEMRPLLAAGELSNLSFKKFLRQKSITEVQDLANEVSMEVEKQVDCTLCGNCCRKLQPGLHHQEAERLASLSQIDEELFKQEHVLFEGEHCYLKAKPCYFLQGNLCKIYDQRPESCRDFPHLRSGHFKYKRSIWINYSLCPIVFNTIERMKKRLGFNQQSG
jgi:Fe-S-cluster containining protein